MRRPPPDVVVPGARHEEVLLDGGGGEGQGRDAVVRGVGDLVVLQSVMQSYNHAPLLHGVS